MRAAIESRGRGVVRRTAEIGRRIAFELVVSAIVLVAVQAAGGGPGLYNLLFGPSRQPVPAVVAQTVRTDDAAVAPKATAPATAPAAVADAKATSGVRVAAAASERERLPVDARRAAAAADEALTVPSGVVLFTQCGERCESRDPLLPRNAEAERQTAATAAFPPSPAPVEPRPAAVPRQAGSGSGWLPGGRVVEHDLGAVGGGIVSLASAAGATASHLMPW